MNQKNYLTHDLEFTPMVFAPKIWRNYFYGVHIYVFTGHKRHHSVFIQKQLNLHQRCLEFLKDYDMSVHNHPGKSNVVANSLSRLYIGNVEHVERERKDLEKDVNRLDRLGLCFMSISDCGVIVQNVSEFSLVNTAKEKQDSDPILP